jgi:hypothetical protein
MRRQPGIAGSLVIGLVTCLHFLGCGRLGPGLMAQRPAGARPTRDIWSKDRVEPATEPTNAERAQRFGFGIVPGVRFGRTSATTAGVSIDTTGQRTAFQNDATSVLLEPTVDFLVVVPDDRVALGAELGYYIAQGYAGPTANGLFMFALTPRAPLILVADAGAVFGTIHDTTESLQAGQTGLRYGAGLMYVVFRTHDIDGALRLDVQRYESGTATLPDGEVKYAGTSLGLGANVSFGSGGP